MVLSAVESASTTWSPEVKPATRDEKAYLKLLDMYIGPLTGTVIFFICLFLMKIPYQTSEEVATVLALQPDEQEAINPPLARILDRLKLDSTVKQAVMNSGDLVGLTLGLAMYGIRVSGVLMTMKGQQENGQLRQSNESATQATGGTGGNGVYIPGIPVSALAQYRPD